MKFPKGLLSDAADEGARIEPDAAPAAQPVPEPSPAPEAAQPAARAQPVYVEKDRLFETVEKTESSARSYLTVLGIVGVLVLIGGVVAWWINRPSAGDKVRVPAAMELAVRDHFLMTEKRTATDISFYQCEGFHWARVGVETRTDIPNPLLRIGTYQARITPAGTGWTVAAKPVTGPEFDIPCQ